MASQKHTDRMLIKLSGEALSDGNNKYSEEVLSDVAKKIKKLLEQDKQICLVIGGGNLFRGCLLYTSPSPRDATLSRMPSSA